MHRMVSVSMPKIFGLREVTIAVLAFFVLLGCTQDNRSVSTASKPSPDRYLVIVDAKTGAVDRFVSIDGLFVGSIAADGKGGWYISTAYALDSGGQRLGLARLKPNGQLDAAFSPSLSGGDYINVLLRHGSVLYAAGHSGVVALDTRTGKQLWRVSLRPANALLNGLAYSGDVLFVGGSYTKIAGVKRGSIAALDARSGRPTEWRVSVSIVQPGYRTLPANVGQIAVAGGVVYFGGDFNRVGKAKRPLGIAAVSARTGRPTSWNPQLDKSRAAYPGAVQPSELSVTHGQVLAGGEGFSVFDARTGKNLVWRRGLRGTVVAFAVSGDTVYLGGIGGLTANGFDRAGGKPANNLASVVLPQGRFTSWRPDVASCTVARTMAVSGDKILIAGVFSANPEC
jgi:outer membrane protein assembly factor BamB